MTERWLRFASIAPGPGPRPVFASPGAHPNAGRTRIVVITGRPAKEICPLLRGNPPVLKDPVEVWGLHGAERMFVDGRRERRTGALLPPSASSTSCGSTSATITWGASSKTSRMLP